LRCGPCASVFPVEYGVPVLFPRRVPEESAAIAEALERIGGNDRRRRRIVGRVLRRLRRNERPPGALRRALWRLGAALAT
jgi:hypothetical protein